VLNPPYEKQIDNLIAAIGLLDQLHFYPLLCGLLKRRRGPQNRVCQEIAYRRNDGPAILRYGSPLHENYFSAMKTTRI
jgi:hypothetical protein